MGKKYLQFYAEIFCLSKPMWIVLFLLYLSVWEYPSEFKGLNTHADISSRIRCLNFDLRFHQNPQLFGIGKAFASPCTDSESIVRGGPILMFFVFFVLFFFS